MEGQPIPDEEGLDPAPRRTRPNQQAAAALDTRLACQAWNLSYNVSVSFDDYHDKFYWVIEGLNYMFDGVRLNEKESRLYWDMAWFISNKIGRDDAAKYYRNLFSGLRGFDGREPPDYVKDFRERFTPPHRVPARLQPPRQLACGQGLVPGGGEQDRPAPLPGARHGHGDLLLRCPHLPVLLRRQPGEGRHVRPVCPAGLARRGSAEWHEFGERPIETAYGQFVQLNRREELFDSAEEQKDQLDALAPGVRDELEKEKRTTSRPEARAPGISTGGLNKYKREKTPQKGGRNPSNRPCSPAWTWTCRAARKPTPTKSRRNHRRPASRRPRGWPRRSSATRMLALNTNRERSKVNFDFWRTRARAEQTAECLAHGRRSTTATRPIARAT